jgi:hypothetical protein
MQFADQLAFVLTLMFAISLSEIDMVMFSLIYSVCIQSEWSCWFSRLWCCNTLCCCWSWNVVLGSIHERSLENIAQIKFVCIELIIYLIQEMAFGLYLLVSDEIFSILFQGK